MCNERGGVVDDLYVYRLGTEQFLLIINASRIEADVAWLEGRAAASGLGASLRLRNVSDEYGAVAIQGPRVVQFIEALFPGAPSAGAAVNSVLELKKNQVGTWTFGTTAVWVARTGYTGEDGFEVVAPASAIESIWERALALGHVGCIQPCGLGARDTLRTEVCYPLYGHELDENTTPIEAGLGFFVALDKGDFLGRSVLAEQKASGVTKKLVAFRMSERSAPPRPGYPVWQGGNSVGTVVSGTQSPTLNAGIGLAYVPPSLGEIGARIEIEIRGKRFAAEIVKRPFYRKA
jgi:aminomethyltransferase